MKNKFLCCLFVLAFIPLVTCFADEPKPPKGFQAIFNGRDLTGWHGLDPHRATKLEGEKKEANLRKKRGDPEM